jgi:hypothetical protein
VALDIRFEGFMLVVVVFIDRWILIEDVVNFFFDVVGQFGSDLAGASRKEVGLGAVLVDGLSEERAT